MARVAGVRGTGGVGGPRTSEGRESLSCSCEAGGCAAMAGASDEACTGDTGGEGERGELDLRNLGLSAGSYRRDGSEGGRGPMLSSTEKSS